MFDIGWTEMLVIAVVMIVVVGPKDLPKMLRTFGKTTGKLRAMAGDFQKQFNEALKEAELDDVKKSVDALRSLNPASEIRKQLNPFEQAAADVRSGIDNAMKPAPKPEVPSATAQAQPAEPLKNGAAALPGVAGPEKMPDRPDVMTFKSPIVPAAAAAEATAAVAADPIAPAARKTPSRKRADKAGPAKLPNEKPAKSGTRTAAAKAVQAAASSPAEIQPAKPAPARARVAKATVANAATKRKPQRTGK